MQDAFAAQTVEALSQIAKELSEIKNLLVGMAKDKAAQETGKPKDKT